MNNQEFNVRPQIVNFNGDDPVFITFSIKTSKCNLVIGTNETKRIDWHEKCKCKGRFNRSVCNNKQPWNDDKCRCKCK